MLGLKPDSNFIRLMSVICATNYQSFLNNMYGTPYLTDPGIMQISVGVKRNILKFSESMLNTHDES